MYYWEERFCLGDFTSDELIKELKRRDRSKTISSDNLYEMSKIEILNEFFNKYNLEQLQDIKELINQYSCMHEDLQDGLHHAEHDEVLEGLDSWLKSMQKIYERLNKRR